MFRVMRADESRGSSWPLLCLLHTGSATARVQLIMSAESGRLSRASCKPALPGSDSWR